MSPDDDHGKRNFAVVVAVTKEFGIGKDGNLPWHPKKLNLDMAALKFLTTHRYSFKEDCSLAFEGEAALGKNVVIMGRKTWDSIPSRCKPMKERLNIIITTDGVKFRYLLSSIDNIFIKMYRDNNPEHPDVIIAESLTLAIEIATRQSPLGQIFILGGAGIYEEALKSDHCECVFITRLIEHPPMPCDTFISQQHLQRYPNTDNITLRCYELLKSTFSKTASVELSSDFQTVSEGDISYQIEAYYK